MKNAGATRSRKTCEVSTLPVDSGDSLAVQHAAVHRRCEGDDGAVETAGNDIGQTSALHR